MFRYLLIGLFLSFTLSSLAQEGDFPIKNHTPSIPGLDNTTFDMAFDKNGLMYIANRSGVLRYDGAQWEYIKTPSAALSLSIDSASNEIFVGCHAHYGYLIMTGNGLTYFNVGVDSLNESFFSTKIIGDSVFYVGSSQLVVYNPQTKAVKKYYSPNKQDIQALNKIDDKLYLSTRNATYLWSDNGFTRNSEWVFDQHPPKKVVKSSNGNYVVLDTSGKIFLEKTSGARVEIDSAAGEAREFDWVNDTMFVVSTLDLGCLMVHGKTGEIIDKVDYESGLPDNEIMDVEVDWSSGIWIAHQFGFSRVDPAAPVRCLSNYEGIEGNLLAEIYFKGQTFVGTSSGLFRLKLDSVFSINISNNKIRVRKEEDESRGLLGLFKRKPDKASYTYRYEQVKTKTFRNTRWIYEQIPEIVSKCNTLVELGDVLLIGTNLGLFEYDGKNISRISDQSVKQIIPFERSGEFFTVGNDRQARRYLYENNIYTQLDFSYDHSSYILSIFHDRGDSIWVITPDKLVLTGLDSGGISSTRVFPFPDKYFDRPTVSRIRDRLYFITKEAFYFYDYRADSLMRDSTLVAEYGVPLEHQHDPSSGFWMFDGKVWKLIEENGESITYSYLSLFPEMRYISKGEQEGEVDFIDQNNQFYRYLARDDLHDIYISNVFYKHVFARSQYNAFRGSFDLAYDENYLSAEISQPDYLGLLKVEFQYRLEGMDKGWSDWSSNNRVELEHLPDGKYVLQIRSRDIFGRIQSMEPITLVVSPPYWQTTWFYLLEVVFFATLVVVSTRLNQKKVQNRFVTEGLTILTIIVIIESLQSIAGSFFAFASSPILDFIINLMIAVVIFPAETFLKQLIRSGGMRLKFKAKKSGATG